MEAALEVEAAAALEEVTAVAEGLETRGLLAQEVTAD